MRRLKRLGDRIGVGALGTRVFPWRCDVIWIAATWAGGRRAPTIVPAHSDGVVRIYRYS